MRRDKRSKVWSHFTVASEKHKIAVCILCKRRFSFKSTVTNLKKHIQNMHIESARKRPELQIIPRNTECTDDKWHNLSFTKIETISVDANPGPSTSRTVNPYYQQPTPSSYFSSDSEAKLVQIQIGMPDENMTDVQKAAIDEKLSLLFIKDFQPFSIVEDKGFREYSYALNPGYYLPTRHHILNTLIPALYERTLNKVRETDFKSINSLSLTTEVWTSASQDAYMAITMHYIDEEYENQNLFLECVSLPSLYTPEHVAEEITRLLNDLNLQKQQILMVTTDKAANMKIAVCDLLHLNHFNCFAHTLNLVLENALDSGPIKSLIERVTSIVSHYKHSTAAMESLLQYQIQTGITQPKRFLQAVPMQWNSINFMLERFLELREALESTINFLDVTLPMPCNEEWILCKDLWRILKPMQEVTQQMCLENYVTLSLVIVYNRVLRNVYENKIPSDLHPEARKSAIVIAEQLKTRLGQIEFSAIYSTCTLLDPRYKSHCFQDKATVEKAKQGLIELVTMEIKKETNIGLPTAAPMPREYSDSYSQQEKNNVELSLWNNLNEILGPSDTAQTPLDLAIIEVQRYLEDRLLPIKDPLGNLNSPAKWWKNHQHIYPNLAKIYQLKFCAMSTSVPCERIFSKSGFLMSDRRRKLSPERVKQLMFLNANM